MMRTPTKRTRTLLRRKFRWTRLVVGVPLIVGTLAAMLMLNDRFYITGVSAALSVIDRQFVGSHFDHLDLNKIIDESKLGREKRRVKNDTSANIPQTTVTSVISDLKISTSVISSIVTTPIIKKFLFFSLECKVKSNISKTKRQKNYNYVYYEDEDAFDEMAYEEYFSDENNQFPPDFFTLEQRQGGAVLFHMFGLVYMFIALAIVCDEFFVPALGVITERLDISEDVAGATFMAAGGSAPEFFTSVIGVFIAQNNVGIGTIVGSATFNILFVLAFCTLFSTTVLQLTWWPLFRDVFFYVLSLMMLLVYFVDEKIEWWEALSLFLVYVCYCFFMKFNEELETWTKSRLGGVSNISTLECTDREQEAPIMEQVAFTENLNLDQLRNTELRGGAIGLNGRTYSTSTYHNKHEATQRCESLANSSFRRRDSLAVGFNGNRRQSIPILHSGAMFRNGIIQLMSQTLDPLTEKDGSESENFESSKNATSHNNGQVPADKSMIVKTPSLKKTAAYENGISVSRTIPRPDSIRSGLSERRSTKADIEQLKSILEEEEEKPLDIAWPERCHKRLIYLFLAPIVFPLWVTLPDVRREESRKWFVATFCLSIAWIALFSYIMVWFANTIGETFAIPTEIIGLTILAAGTSIPDLITSVIVARKGLGDMAVSSSVGSNIFDVCVGLPVPWLLYFVYGAFRGIGGTIAVSSNGLICSLGMLFIMLLLLLTAIMLCGWKMSKIFGVIMLISYTAFCVFSVQLETGSFVCPLRLC